MVQDGLNPKTLPPCLLPKDLCGLHGWMMPEACAFQLGLVYRELQWRWEEELAQHPQC